MHTVPDNSSHLWQWLGGLVLLGQCAEVTVWSFDPDNQRLTEQK